MATARERGQVRLLGFTARRRAELLISTALQASSLLVVASPVWAQPAPNARPTGGSVVAGGASIAQSGSATKIDQTSQRAVINWQSYNVGGQQTVAYAQPSSSAIALNRVAGPDPSQIAGRIDANGQVVLVNQAGVTFYKGAQVNAQSLIVSTANISNQNFMAGRMVFDQPGGPNASVVNQGTLTVKQAGLAALVAPNVVNSGVINAKLGHVVLAGAKTSTLDLYGDGLLSLDVGNQVTTAPIGPDGKPVAALVTNSGVIRADGGTVQLTAAAADGLVQTLVDAGGTLRANSVGAQNGTVTVSGIGGSVSVTGLVSASGKAANTTGGQVAVNATGDVTLAPTAHIVASGKAGGGTVAIGTTLARARGGPGTTATMTAANVNVNPGARVDASATTSGHGGRVTVLSGGTTNMAGTIAARGGSQSGDGGFAEVSGDTLNLSGLVNTSAPFGNLGTILLDPTNLNIVATTGNLDGQFAGGTLAAGVPDGTPPPSTVSSGELTALGLVGNVVVQASGLIDVLVPVTVKNDLTLQAGGPLTIGASVTSTNGNLVALAGGTIDVAAPMTAAKGLTIQAGDNLTIENGAPISAGGDILLQAGTLTTPSTLNIGASVTSTNGNVIALAGASFATKDVLEDPLFIAGNVAATNGSVQLQATGQVVIGAAVSSTDATGAGGHVFVLSLGTAGITIQPGAAVTTGTVAGVASFRADSFSIGTVVPEVGPAVTGTVTAGTFELAPFSSGQVVNLGSFIGGGLVLPSLANVNAGTVRIGAVTPPGATTPGTPVAASITITGTGGPFDVGNRSLELDAAGPIDGNAGAVINVTTLSGTGGAWTLTSANSVANIGAVSASSFSLTDTIALNVGGTLAAGTNLTINDTGTLTISGVASAAAVSLTADAIAIPGEVTDGGVGTVALFANTGTISETGTLIAGVLSGSAFGVADLLGTGPTDTGPTVNQVAQLASPGSGTITTVFIPPGTFTASSFALRDRNPLSVNGAVTATGTNGQVYLESPAITITTNGAISATGTSGLVSLQTDQLTNSGASGAVSANTIELAPATQGGIVTLGTTATGGGLSLATTTGLTLTNLTIGAVTQPNAAAPATTAGAIAIDGPFTFSGTAGVLTLDASSAGGATGSVTQAAPLTISLGVTLSGTASDFVLTNTANSFGDIAAVIASREDADFISTLELFSTGVSAPAGNVFLSSANAAGVVLLGPATALGRVSIEADALGSDGGSVTANTFELAPFTPGNPMTLGAAGGLSLITLLDPNLPIAVTTLRIGAVTPPGGGPLDFTAGSATIAGQGFNSTPATTLELDAIAAGAGTGAISQSAPLLGVGTLAANGTGIVLLTPGNQIAATSTLIASTGNVELADASNLTLNGVSSGGNLFFEVSTAGGTLALGSASPATLTSTLGLISLVADNMAALPGQTTGNGGGTVEISPISAIGVAVGGSGNGMVGTAVLASVNVPAGTLLIGNFTNPVTGTRTTPPIATAITLSGDVNLAGKVGTLDLEANGPVTQPAGSLTVATVTGTSVGDFSLNNAKNQIQASTGIIAAGGNVVLVDDPTLQLTGLYSGTNLFFQVTQPGGSLALGDADAPATLVSTLTTGGRITLAADSITATAASTITAPGGTVEIAPFSAINESVLGTNAIGQLLVDATLLGDIVTSGTSAPSTLVIGGYSNLSPTGATLPVAASAGSVTLDGALNLTGTAATLALLSIGSVTEPGGPLSVTNVTGSSAGLFSLVNKNNAIVQSLGIAASNGDVVLVDGVDLTLTGLHQGNNLFFEVAAAGDTLQLGALQVTAPSLPASLTAGTGGRVTLVADQITEIATSTLTAPAGTVELAPFSPINTSLLGTSGVGQLLIQPALLSSITPGISTLVVGGFTNFPAGATNSASSAASVTVDNTVSLAPLATTLDLEATGAVTQSAPIVNVGTLLGITGSTTLTNSSNSVGTLGNYVASNGLALTNATNLLIAGAVFAGPSAQFNIGGALTETGGVTANHLSGAAAGTASLTGGNTVANLDNFTVNGNAGTFALNDSGNLSINGALTATHIAVLDPSSGITLAGGASIVTGGTTRPSGLTVAPSLLPQNGAPGAFLQAASFTQTGNSTIVGQNGGPSSLQISVTGNMRFDPPLGLTATGTWLTLNLTNGTANGDIFVAALDVSYTLPGGANLFGSINGVSSPFASSLGFAEPVPNVHYLFNNCEIGTVNCAIASLAAQRLLTETAVYVPLEALLSLVTPALVLDPRDKDDLLQSPVVSRDDY